MSVSIYASGNMYVCMFVGVHVNVGNRRIGATNGQLQAKLGVGIKVSSFRALQQI